MDFNFEALMSHIEEFLLKIVAIFEEIAGALNIDLGLTEEATGA